MNYHQIIEQHAAGGTSTAAGDLHEELWDSLLRREEPRFHNVRVTRGDGGIDGIAFIDPVNATCHVYQAKFYPELKDEKGTRKAAIVDAFIKALKHSFECVQWTLLLPRELSHADLNWLTVDLRKEALDALNGEASPNAAAITRAQSCAIEFKDGKDLDRMLRANLDVAGRLLPESHLALLEQVNKERSERDRDRAELAERLAILKDEAIRNHAADSRRARAALSILNQGWANLTGMLQRAIADPRLVASKLDDIAGQVEQHAIGRATHAYACEGLVPGISQMVAEINYQSRVLQQVSIMKDIGMADTDGTDAIARKIIDAIGDLQRRIGEVSLSLSGPA
jgi:hypothetical protein